MNPQLALVLALLTVCVVLFVVNRPRMDVVALLAVAALPLTGIVSVNEALAGFSDQNVILIGLLFVVGESLVRTGVANRIGEFMLHHSSGSEVRLLILLMLGVAAVGSIMSSTGVVAIFIPVVLLISTRRSLDPGKFMMPLAFAGLISGMLTLVGTAPNLVVDAALEHAGHRGFSFFSFTPFGAAILGAGVLYMLVARRFLPRRPGNSSATRKRRQLIDLIQEYQLQDRAHRLRIGTDSPLIGKTVAEMAPRRQFTANVVAVERKGRRQTEVLEPRPDLILQKGDVLLIDLEQPPSEEMKASAAKLKLEPLSLRSLYFSDHSREIGMAEILLPPGSSLTGQTVIEAAIRTRFRLNVIGLRRGGEALPSSPCAVKLRPGDTLLVIGRWKHIRNLAKRVHEVILLTLPAESDEAPPAASRAGFALASLLVMMVLMITGWVPNAIAALICCLLMGATRCINLDSAYRSIQWPSLILIVGMMPFSTALQKTGGVDLAVNLLLDVFGGSQPRILLGALFLLTAGTGLFVSNTATAVLMTPIALKAAEALKVSPYPFAMTVALAASCAFMTPVSSPVNTLVMGPGNYRFSDFLIIGVPFTAIAMALTLLLVPWLLPF
ncbi:SLC13 family permease [Haloferula sp. BvORR071]|uniref:SLC13 family permease n=1 Tax=Haloferula sp. BvORR071 TaxID=1396141 RepID=UPI00054D3135|nr:SLC13 family permease [Haloferula sp. BvORR071]